MTSKDIERMRKAYSPRQEWEKFEDKLAWIEWALTETPKQLAPDTVTTFKPRRMLIKSMVRSWMP